MAQTGSAQREPSMEEILASIRRIIEDSDAVRSPDDELEQHLDLEISAANTQPDTAGEVEAFRLELDDASPEHTVPTVDAPFAARDTMADYQPSGPQPSAPMADIHPLHNQDEPVAQAAPAEVEEPAAPSMAAMVPAGEDARTSLISEQPARQVAAAFGELSEAFAASRRRSFDEMAEEMLRPMLQEWLDNNLPTLVEKLVREEIERVARGG